MNSAKCAHTQAKYRIPFILDIILQNDSTYKVLFANKNISTVYSRSITLVQNIYIYIF